MSDLITQAYHTNISNRQHCRMLINPFAERIILCLGILSTAVEPMIAERAAHCVIFSTNLCCFRNSIGRYGFVWCHSHKTHSIYNKYLNFHLPRTLIWKRCWLHVSITFFFKLQCLNRGDGWWPHTARQWRQVFKATLNRTFLIKKKTVALVWAVWMAFSKNLSIRSLIKHD